ncbi:MAG: HAMP domain-containing sensor histidine kinase [Desulfobacteraceae bacterium]|nr:HAMP domain-containing sensor histidine kinase [Desulfobacteraceae bacterium]
MITTPPKAQMILSSPDDLALAVRALRQRPRLTIRLCVALGFMGTFVLICIMTGAAMIFMSKLGAKEMFIEKAGNYTFEIQQARRFEKNFLLYGTDLADALTYVGNAKEILNTEREDFRAIIGAKAYTQMAANLDHYDALLKSLEKTAGPTNAHNEEALNALQAELRRSGAELVADAANAVDKERLSFHRWLHSAKIIAAFFLILILIFEILIVTFIARQIFLPFKRFENYMRRIAEGDFSPVTPVKKFQDEFSDLAVAVNRMLKEIQDRGNQLVESRKMAAIGTLTAGIAHEINNPLNNISLTAEALIDDFQALGEEEKLEMLKEISGQVERAAATVANLLDFTQRDRSAFKPLAIRDVITASAALLNSELALNHITLKVSEEDHLPLVLGHFQNLQQVFLNLFINAKEAMPEGGELDVHCTLQGDLVRVDIRDTGIGIPERHLSRIFDPFFTTKEVGKGTGLGLSVSFGIIERHHGTISVKSEINNGTTFTILLPVVKG